MICATILLDKQNRYVNRFGNLPHRPSYDKELLTSVLTGSVVSKEGYSLLPPSIKSIVDVTDQIEPTGPVTIREIDALTDLLIVSRSQKLCNGGKEFRFTNFEPIVKNKDIELWKRKH